ncbi:hypothetical protein ACP70R_035938 [Stipagrostis hirtigluma subsp. patula]
MAEVVSKQFQPLALNGRNYQTWAEDCQFHLAAMQLTHTITPHTAGAANPPLHELAKAAIFLRRHIHPDLKMEYAEMRDPLQLWYALQERFGKQQEVILPQARRDWAQLRFLDFKSVEAYNNTVHRIVGQLRFCGQNITEAEMIEKTLETFHPSNMVLQQQYRNNKYKKYSELIQVLLAAETQNELLMKNFNMRPVGSQAVPEVHASFRSDKGQARSKGKWRSGKHAAKGGRLKKQANKGPKPNGNGKSQKGSQRNADKKHPLTGLFPLWIPEALVP